MDKKKVKKVVKKKINKKFPKFKHVWLEIFTENIYYICCTYDEYITAIKSEFDTVAPSNDGDVTGRFLVYNKKDTRIATIWHDSKCSKDTDIIVHEVFHAVHYITQKKGMWLHDSSEEIYAYLMQYIVGEIQKLRKKKK